MSAVTSQPPPTLDLPEFERPPDDPMELFARWLAASRELGVREPGALSLATADSEGRSSVRIVMLLDVTADGLVFSSHAGSRKGREIAQTGWGSAALFWRETRQQITMSGPLRRLPDARSDELWASRPVSTHPMSVASEQSAPLEDEQALRDDAERLARSPHPHPRPEQWCGYELAPSSIEFWHESPDRLHRRLLYDRSPAGWTTRRLQP